MCDVTYCFVSYEYDLHRVLWETSRYPNVYIYLCLPIINQYRKMLSGMLDQKHCEKLWLYKITSYNFITIEYLWKYFLFFLMTREV